jgi:hypothetical protein
MEDRYYAILAGDEEDWRAQHGSIYFIEHPVISIEVKARAKLPAWIEDAMRQAESSARDKIPMVMLHEDSRRYVAALVMCRLSEFVELLETKRGKHKAVTQQVSAP